MTIWDDTTSGDNGSSVSSSFGEFLVEINLTDGVDPILMQKLNNNFMYLRDHLSEPQTIQLTDNIDSSDEYTIEPYELPPATRATLGGIIVGDNLTITDDGVLDADGGALDLDLLDEELF